MDQWHSLQIYNKSDFAMPSPVIKDKRVPKQLFLGPTPRGVLPVHIELGAVGSVFEQTSRRPEVGFVSSTSTATKFEMVRPIIPIYIVCSSMFSSGLG